MAININDYKNINIGNPSEILRDNINDNTDLTIENFQYLNSTILKATQKTILTTDWTANVAIISVIGITANTNIIQIAGDPTTQENLIAWNNLDILEMQQGANTITITCSETPTSNIVINIAYGGGAT